jgi:hypothetical protein
MPPYSSFQALYVVFVYAVAAAESFALENLAGLARAEEES